MVGPIPSVTLSVALLTVLLLVVALGLALLGSTVLLPQGAPAVLMVLAAALFLGLQVVVFRVFGLHSRADQEPSETSGPEDDERDDDPDWRAWNG